MHLYGYLCHVHVETLLDCSYLIITIFEFMLRAYKLYLVPYCNSLFISHNTVERK